MDTITPKTVDIEKILRGKLGSKARWVPGPLVSWLKKIAHEDTVNGFLWEARDLKGTPWLEATLRHLDTKIEVEGMENLPPKDDGKLYTFVSNHPMGGIDGVALGAVIGKQYDDRFRYLVNDLLMNLPGLAPLCIPINKTGYATCRGKRPSSARAWRPTATWCPYTSAGATATSSIACRTSATAT